jgi:hypothetical protein
VADGFLEQEVNRALNETMRSTDRDITRDVIIVSPSWDLTPERLMRTVGARLSRARTDPAYRDGLVAYLGDDYTPPEKPGHCRGCNTELWVAERRTVGRQRQHCDNACKQLAYRNRKRAEKAATQRALAQRETLHRRPTDLDSSAGERSRWSTSW